MGVIPRWDAGATGIASQPFTGSTAPGWVLGGGATLTGGGVDPAGDGWLRLTDTGPSAETGYAYYDSAFPSGPGVSLSFDYASWGGGGADGTSFFLWDGSVPFSVGQSGGSLGYANGCGTPGVSGGYVGIGLDEFGNYANALDNCHNGGDGTPFQPFNQQVGLRGASAGGYMWLAGSGLLTQSLSFPFTNARPDQTGAGFRHVALTISPAGILNLQVQFGAGTTPVSVISGYNLAAQGAPPATYKLAFVGSTGAVNDYHELRNLMLTDYEGTTASGVTFAAAEGMPYNGPVATITDPDPAASAAEYTASINWGDGSPATMGSISGPAGGPFTVMGSHTYADEGPFTPVVSIADADDMTNTAGATDSVTVGDGALNASGNPATLQTANTALSSVPVATFTDANPGATSADFTASINWGDGSPATLGNVTGPAGGPFVVKGSHSYTVLGPHTISVSVSDDGGSTATASSNVLLYADLAHGSFVIGNNNAGMGSTVTFWGAQWSTHNSFSQRSFADHFLGFENLRTLPACNGAWVNIVNPRLGAPPASVPSYMAVISTSSMLNIGQFGIGNIAHVVIVKTDPGYAADPSHAGTGTVVGTIC